MKNENQPGNVNPALSEELFHKMTEHTNQVYKFVKIYNDYANAPRDYGTGEKVNMLSVHIMSDIEEHPGITVTELAEEWVRTKGSISQVIKNLDENGYIIKKKEGNNNKNVHLYPTSKGVELSLAHKMYDARNLKNTLDFFTQYCTEEELTAFYKVLGYYTMLLKGEQKGAD